MKGLVIPQSLRQFGSWLRFGESVTKELHRRRTIQGSFAIITGVPWEFNQKQSKLLAKTFVDALTDVSSSIDLGAQVDLGPVIAPRFSEWPAKPPTIDQKLWREQHVYGKVHNVSPHRLRYAFAVHAMKTEWRPLQPGYRRQQPECQSQARTHPLFLELPSVASQRPHSPQEGRLTHAGLTSLRFSARSLLEVRFPAYPGHPPTL